jgi:hypothetical protein
MLLWSPWVWPVILTIAAISFAIWSESRRERISGRATGLAIGELLPDGCEVWADGAIEARPEVLAYAVQRAAQLGRAVHPRWIALADRPLPGPGAPPTFLLLRADELGEEAAAYASLVPDPGLTEAGHWSVYKYRFQLLEVPARLTQPAATN